VAKSKEFCPVSGEVCDKRKSLQEEDSKRVRRWEGPCLSSLPFPSDHGRIKIVTQQNCHGGFPIKLLIWKSV